MSYNPKTGMYEGYIYCIKNLLNEMKYIGQTSRTISIRWNQHKKDMWIENNNKFYNAMKKYGVENFSIRELEKIECSGKDELLDKLDLLEQKYIEQFNTYPNEYNSTPGGRNSFGQQGRKVNQYDMHGNFLRSHDSVDNLKQFLNKTCVSSIYTCCMGEIKYAYGYIWRYAEDDLYKYELPNDREIQEAEIRVKSLGKIKKYDLLGNLMFIYEKIEDAIKDNVVTRNQIISSCSGEKISGGGYVWRFNEDNFETYKCHNDKFKTVYQYDLEYNLLNIFVSTREAARQTGVCFAGIGMACRGQLKKSGGFIWSYIPLNNTFNVF